MKLALAAGGLSAGEYTSKLNLFLNPDMSAEQALKKILLRLLEIMQQKQKTGKRFKDRYAAYSSSDRQKKFREMFVDYHRRR